MTLNQHEILHQNHQGYESAIVKKMLQTTLGYVQFFSLNI